MKATYIVEGDSEFPVDMLRHDQSHYQNAISQSVAEQTWDQHKGERRRVVLDMDYPVTRFWEPNIKRWESFGWRVITITRGDQTERLDPVPEPRPKSRTPELDRLRVAPRGAKAVLFEVVLTTREKELLLSRIAHFSEDDPEVTVDLANIEAKIRNAPRRP